MKKEHIVKYALTAAIVIASFFGGAKLGDAVDIATDPIALQEACKSLAADGKLEGVGVVPAPVTPVVTPTPQ